MSPEEKQARLNLVRYGLLLVVVVAMTVTPASLWLVAAPLGQPTLVLMPTIVATVITAIVAVAVYYGYSNYLSRR